MIDDRSQYFNLPLPNAANTLQEDVARLVQALQAVDSAAKGFKDKTDSDDAQLGTIQALVNAAKSASSSLSTLSSTLSSHQHTGGNGGTIPYTSLTGTPTLGDSAARNVGTGAITVCAGDDARLSNARTPSAHKSSHATGGGDAMTPGDIGAQAAITGAASSVVTSNLSANMALVAGSTGKIEAHSTVSATELGYLNDVTSAVQTQLNGKQAAHSNLTAFAGKTAPSGNVVGTTDPQTLSAKTLTGLRETQTAPSISGGTLTLDCAVGNVFAVALNANITTFQFSNVPTSGTAYGCTVEFTADGSQRAIAWGAAVKWPGGTAPTMTATHGTVDRVVLTTRDGGTTWYAAVAGQNY
jgi:hypothetical protein